MRFHNEKKFENLIPLSHFWPLSYLDTDVVLMCFAIDSPDSLMNVPEKWTPELRHYCPHTPIILVGNKKDLRADPSTIRELARKKQETVKYEQAKAFAESIGAYAYVECSAKTRDGIREVFETATRAALQQKKTKKNKQKSKNHPVCSII